MKLLVTLGCDPPAADRAQTETAALVEIDWDTKRILRSLCYQSPPEHAGPPGQMTFAHGQLAGDQLLVTTATELVFVDLERWKVQRTISRGEFNDLHHAVVDGDTLWVCDTGLQAVLGLSGEGELREVHGTNGANPWDVYDPGVDWRRVETKPHTVHPNHLVVVDGELWVTRFHQRDAVLVRDHDRRMRIDVGNPHDGIYERGLVHFTTTAGRVVACDPRTGDRVREVDLYAHDARRRERAWCRGLALLDGDLAFVGMTQLRPTRWKNMAHWVLQDGKARLPSRIALYDLADQRLIDELPLEGRWSGASIYSIFVRG